MKASDVEHRVRQLAWPSPPESLRARILADPAVGEPPVLLSARVAGDRDPARRKRMPPPEGEDAGHGWRRAGALIALGILLMVGSCVGLDVREGRRVDAAIAAFEQRYGSLDERASQLPEVPVADNRARVVRAAATLTVPRPGLRTHYIMLRATEPVPADLRAFAESNRTAIRLVGDIRTRQQSSWEVDARRGYDVPPLFEPVRMLSDAIFVTALMDLEAGRPDAASAMIVSGLGITASMKQEPALFIEMVRTSLAWRHIEAIQQLLATSSPSKTALREVAWWLAENRTPNGMPALLAEVRHVNATFLRMEQGEMDANTASYIYPMTWPSWPRVFLRPAARIGQPFVREARVRYLQQMARLLDAESGPRPRRPVLEPPEPARWALIDRLTVLFTAGTWRYSESGDDSLSELGLAELAVALRRFKLDHRTYPDNLSALVPAYLAQLPIDPFTGQLFAYARQGDGFTLRAKGSSPEMAAWRKFEWTVPK